MQSSLLTKISNRSSIWHTVTDLASYTDIMLGRICSSEDQILPVCLRVAGKPQHLIARRCAGRIYLRIELHQF